MHRLKPYTDLHPDIIPELVEHAAWLESRRIANRAPASGEAVTRTDVERRLPQGDRRENTAEREHPLAGVFNSALSQAMYGKGERHGGATVPFLDQPWLKIAEVHGKGFLTGQAVKKLEEAVRGKEGEAYEKELLGAMVYLGMAVIKHRLDQGEKS